MHVKRIGENKRKYAREHVWKSRRNGRANSWDVVKRDPQRNNALLCVLRNARGLQGERTGKGKRKYTRECAR